jgi:hypothetical protein
MAVFEPPVVFLKSAPEPRALTNPDQATHLRAINDAVELRFPNTPYGSNYTRMTGVIQYHNYGLFSTTGFLDMTFSYVFGHSDHERHFYVATGVLPSDRLRSPPAQR